jgi:hypothetical protein
MTIDELKSLVLWMRDHRVQAFAHEGTSVTFHPLAFVDEPRTTMSPGAEATEPANKPASQEQAFDGMDMGTLLHSA